MNKNYSARKKLEALRTFYRFVHESGWLATNPATLVKPPKVDDEPTLRTAKTGTAIRVPLPRTAVEELNALPAAGGYYFWSGFGERKSCVGDYQRAFKKLYELAGVKNGHAHRWRDTFAVELLLARVPLEQVSVFLGHQSIKVTERHYSPWVKARQEQLEAAVRSTFEPHKSVTTENQSPNRQ